MLGCNVETLLFSQYQCVPKVCTGRFVNPASFSDNEYGWIKESQLLVCMCLGILLISYIYTYVSSFIIIIIVNITTY